MDEYGNYDFPTDIKLEKPNYATSTVGNDLTDIMYQILESVKEENQMIISRTEYESDGNIYEHSVSNGEEYEEIDFIQKKKSIPCTIHFGGQRIGHWRPIYQGDEIINYRCSECEQGNTFGKGTYGMNYCPYCGSPVPKKFPIYLTNGKWYNPND